MEINLRGKVAVVTGSAGGLGRRIAEKLHECGAAVAATDLDLEAVREKFPQADDRTLMQRDVGNGPLEYAVVSHRQSFTQRVPYRDAQGSISLMGSKPNGSAPAGTSRSVAKVSPVVGLT